MFCAILNADPLIAECFFHVSPRTAANEGVKAFGGHCAKVRGLLRCCVPQVVTGRTAVHCWFAGMEACRTEQKKWLQPLRYLPATHNPYL